LNKIVPRDYFEDETHRLAESILQRFETQRYKISREELIRQLIVLYKQHLEN
jgi:hypothetical protein